MYAPVAVFLGIFYIIFVALRKMPPKRMQDVGRPITIARRCCQYSKSMYVEYLIDAFVLKRHFFVHAINILSPVLDSKLLEPGAFERIRDDGTYRKHQMMVHKHLFLDDALEEREIFWIERFEYRV